MIRPGPMGVAPGLCPGGVVVHVYSVPGEVLICEQRLHPGSDVEVAATVAAQLADGYGPRTCLVAYDGDTGERMTAEAWVA